ncbi:MAG: hypothetical protein KVP17_000254 [Porospora cf. gigantea B]|uniref:uncharacterized protein n=1 Tax=Porospora cf. gigantea B TaxID=2853592 RepID=UPI0035719C08|nr:MAG: hypothetical protein KVP17_000254 [Porospora cf. gigantea B]
MNGPGPSTALVPGMVMSNEPGFYQTGQYGIRHENLVYVVPGADPEWYQFKQLTCVPFQKKCLQMDLLSEEHVSWLNAYHMVCLEKVTAYMSEHMADVPDFESTMGWLKAACAPLLAVPQVSQVVSPEDLF